MAYIFRGVKGAETCGIGGLREMAKKVF
jgi:hypothetical protein